MLVSKLVASAFATARQRFPELHSSWIQASHRVGGLLPASLLIAAVQRDGDLDLLLRSMEDEQSLPSENNEASILQIHYQKTLSEVWVGGVYETLRLLKERKLGPDSDEFRALKHDLRLLRIPLEKHEITRQGQLEAPTNLRRLPPNNDETDLYEYSKTDPQRAHIMPSGISGRGSVMWQVLDLEANDERWIERRALSERLLSLWSAKQAELA